MLFALESLGNPIHRCATVDRVEWSVESSTSNYMITLTDFAALPLLRYPVCYAQRASQQILKTNIPFIIEPLSCLSLLESAKSKLGHLTWQSFKQ